MKTPNEIKKEIEEFKKSGFYTFEYYTLLGILQGREEQAQEFQKKIDELKESVYENIRHCNRMIKASKYFGKAREKEPLHSARILRVKEPAKYYKYMIELYYKELDVIDKIFSEEGEGKE